MDQFTASSRDCCSGDNNALDDMSCLKEGPRREGCARRCFADNKYLCVTSTSLCDCLHLKCGSLVLSVPVSKKGIEISVM